MKVRVVTRAQFTVALCGAWSGGSVDFLAVPRLPWGGRTGAALIAWLDARATQVPA